MRRLEEEERVSSKCPSAGQGEGQEKKEEDSLQVKEALIRDVIGPAVLDSSFLLLLLLLLLLFFFFWTGEGVAGPGRIYPRISLPTVTFASLKN